MSLEAHSDIDLFVQMRDWLCDEENISNLSSDHAKARPVMLEALQQKKLAVEFRVTLEDQPDDRSNFTIHGADGSKNAGRCVIEIHKSRIELNAAELNDKAVGLMAVDVLDLFDKNMMPRRNQVIQERLTVG